jgi:Fe-S cluster biogenesis protein NfuA
MGDREQGSLAARVARVLAEEVGPSLELPTDGLELVAVDGGMARVRVRGGCVG